MNAQAAAQRYEHALKLLNEPAGYGKNNELLYLLDKGMVLHLAGRYEDSIDAFAKAKQKFDELYTQSLSKIAASLVTNDYVKAYRGEDFERVLINVFQALNYLALGNIPEALVEARDVDSRLHAINAQYPSEQKNVYRQDAFVRMFMGILYEALETPGHLNDAFISYEKAMAAYESDYQYNYHLSAPMVLKENIQSVAEFMGKQEQDRLRQKFPDVTFPSLKERGQKAEVYLILYQGLSPVKFETSVFLPLPGGSFTSFAFPEYRQRIYPQRQGVFCAQDSERKEFCASTELAENIGGIARKNLENRKARIIAKSLLRSGGRYLLIKSQEQRIRDKHGDEAAAWFRFVADLFGIYLERADLRSWQTLPDTISVSRLSLNSGTYDFFADKKNIGHMDLEAGQIKFLYSRIR